MADDSWAREYQPDPRVSYSPLVRLAAARFEAFDRALDVLGTRAVQAAGLALATAFLAGVAHLHPAVAAVVWGLCGAAAVCGLQAARPISTVVPGPARQLLELVLDRDVEEAVLKGLVAVSFEAAAEGARAAARRRSRLVTCSFLLTALGAATCATGVILAAVL
ncbi:MAG: hypothetical protein J7M26_03455 [Armatimonadetes bacterium]|nr:hypothetical protein [Armatimonadota bacterium]